MTESLLDTSSQPSQLEQIRPQVTSLLELDEEMFAASSGAFIKSRLAELMAEGPQEEQLSTINGNTKGFIHPETQIFPFALCKGYQLDDRAIYDEVLPNMRNTYTHVLEQIQDLGEAYSNAVLMTAQLTQQSYFGGVHNPPGAYDRREFLLGDFISMDDEPAPEVRSIAEFKGVAMCAERAAVANNVLHILGMQPVLEMGRLKIGEHPSEPHAYLFIQSPSGKELVYDPTNPTLIFDSNGSLVHVSPAVYLAGSALAARDGAAPIEGMHKTYELTDQGQRMTEEKCYQFTLNTFGQELHPE